MSRYTMSGKLERLAAEWADIRQLYTFHEGREADYTIKLRMRYGTHVSAIVYASRKEQHRLEMLQNAEKRAYERCFRWLDKHSPWDWHSGTSAHWICSRLTAAMALSVEAPVVPGEAAGYGSPRVPHSPERRRERQEAVGA